MELLIKIPKEFEQHFKQDAFEDSLNRLCADAHLLAGLYEQETAKMLIDAFKSAVPVPPHRRLIDAAVARCKDCREPMSDLISRQAAIDEIEEYADRLQMVDWNKNPGVMYKANPDYYKTGGIEPIDFIKEQKLDFDLGNVVKYVCRAGRKTVDPKGDLEKAMYYLQHELKSISDKEKQIEEKGWV